MATLKNVLELVNLYLSNQRSLQTRVRRIDDWWIGMERADGSARFYALKASVHKLQRRPSK